MPATASPLAAFAVAALTDRIRTDTVQFDYEIRETAEFSTWLGALRDARAKARIIARLGSARLGNLGDIRSVGGEVSEMRVHAGAGYRVYFTRRGRAVIILLCGGDKSSQARDIPRAIELALSHR